MTNDPHLDGLAGPILHDETVAARAPWRHRVNAGETLRVTAWRGPVTPEDDPIRTATAERRRAFLNTEDLYRR